MSIQQQQTASPADRTRTADNDWRGQVTILAVGSFAMGTDSFVLAGILPQISSGLGQSISAIGQAITVFSLTYGLTAPFLAAFTSRLPRKPLMAFALALFVVANLASAAAPTLALLLVARVAAGLGAALYTPNASAAAAALAGPAHRGQALAAVLGGLTVGTVLGVPVGTWIGQHLSWQASLIFVACVGAVALAGLLAVLPSLPLPPAVPLRARFAVLANARVVAIVAFMLLESAAAILVYTYIAHVLDDTVHARGTTLALLLLAWGVGGAVGAFGSGRLTDRWGADRTLSLAIGVLAVTLAALAVSTSLPLAFVVMALNGAAGWAVATPNNHRLTEFVPHLPSVVISFNSSGIYLGQAIGAGLGGVLLGAISTAQLCYVGAGIAVLAAALHLLIAAGPRARPRSCRRSASSDGR
ncbi:Predicted arabinose efflux permease, MFS family [Nonomuraea maritima]|uniref:Predicted arabinose efflux permease, MFS family n=1 Tax=Nonomuraea maritima TaxID=683260 RepID=A0A1G9BKH2_9ACTN|nr:MFS transporter [Nonomuraea maritima]SDK39654.1 Predicted arabinose efflux permease, MFS family [Nonomuraea maritima]